MTSDVALARGLTTSEVAQQNNRTNGATTELNKNFNEFLSLLTAQLQNQDPLNPTDSTEFTNQLVQFSQVEQAINTNQKLDLLINQQFANATTSALGFVGLDITYPSAEVAYDGSNDANLSYFMPSGKDVAEAKLNIRDADGILVYSENVNQTAGRHNLSWNGIDNGGLQADPGTYSFSIDALDSDGNSINDISTIVTGRVTGVETQNGLSFLIVGDRAVQVTDVIQAKNPSPILPAGNDGETEGNTPEEDA